MTAYKIQTAVVISPVTHALTETPETLRDANTLRVATI
jgi:hypothetical protein